MSQHFEVDDCPGADMLVPICPDLWKLANFKDSLVAESVWKKPVDAMTGCHFISRDTDLEPNQKNPWIKMVGYQLDDHHQNLLHRKMAKKSPNVHPFSKNNWQRLTVPGKVHPSFELRRQHVHHSGFQRGWTLSLEETKKTTKSMVGWAETDHYVWYGFISSTIPG